MIIVIGAGRLYFVSSVRFLSSTVLYLIIALFSLITLMKCVIFIYISLIDFDSSIDLQLYIC